MNEFFIPGSGESPYDSASDEMLHLAGLDFSGVYADPFDLYGGDQDIQVDTPKEWAREHLPQFGPPFVRYVHERIDVLEHLARKQLERWSYEPVTAFFVASMQTSATGAISWAAQDKAILFEPQPGWTFALHRLAISAVGFTFGAPFTGANSWWEIRANDGLILGNSMVSGQGQLPIVGTWGTRDAPHIRDGENLNFFMSGGPANTTITLRGQGTLERQAES